MAQHSTSQDDGGAKFPNIGLGLHQRLNFKTSSWAFVLRHAAEHKIPVL